jgi:hypothetical protein
MKKDKILEAYELMLNEHLQLNEAYQMVKIEGLPNFVIQGSASSVKTLLRQKMRKPDDIISISKITRGEMAKYFRDFVAGKEEE